MVYFHSSISLCKPVDQTPVVANSECSSEFGSNSRQTNSTQRNRRMSNSPNSPQVVTCDRSRWAVVEVALFIAAICAFGFLFFPFIYYVITGSIKICCAILYAVKEEVSLAPPIFMYVGFGVSLAAISIWGVLTCTSRKCGNPGCKGMRKAAEFDIQLETEDCVKNSPNEGIKKGLFELPRDHHRELELELKKIAPPNGRAVLILRARCGCSVGRLEVPGPKKPRKIKR
ncbi:hypothetical protein K1719_007604 [Acacia pycnantha]|nr:hypothetical protein K1719_007604 [Acacia pycnantha]